MARCVVLFAFLAVLASLALAKPERATAVAFLRETNPTQHLIVGQAYFYQDHEDGDVRVEVFAYGNDGFLGQKLDYAMQVHEYGDITARNGNLVGNHLITEDFQQHSCPEDRHTGNLRHTGDMGNFWVNAQRQLIDGKTLNVMTTYNNSDSIVGRAFVMKTEKDPCGGDFIGRALAFGTIGLASFAPNAVGITLDDDDQWLAAYITGSGACYRCEGEMWAFRESSSRVRILAKAYLPARAPDAHQFTITQYGDITVKNGDLMGGIYKSDSDQVHKLPNEDDGQPGDLGNNQWYSEYDDDDFTWSWLNLTIEARLSEIAGRGVQVYESYDRGDACPPSGGGGRLFAFGVLGVANPDNRPPRSFPDDLERVGELDNDGCAGGFLGVGLTSLLLLLVALFLVM